MVWCGIMGETLVGPYFFQGNVNQHTYLELLENYLVPTLHDRAIDRANVIFMHDGATPHFVLNIREWLDENLPGWMGRGGTIQWPAHSPDVVALFNGQLIHPTLPGVTFFFGLL